MSDVINSSMVYAFNRWEDWLIALLIFAVSFVLLLVIRQFAARQLLKLSARTVTDVDDFVAQLLVKTKAALLLVFALFFASLRLHLSASIEQFLRVAAVIALLIQIGLWIIALIDYWVQREAKRSDLGGGQATTLSVVGVMLKIAVWVLLVLIALDNIPGVEITTLVASLGIGGIAVGLAVQSILRDLFASLSIALDRPFVIGDSITVDGLSGTVEHLGLKSVRVRSISGEQIVFSTSDLLNSRVHNFEKLERRRAVLRFGVVHHTPPQALAMIPAMLEEVIANHAQVSFERAHFTSIGASVLEFEAVYWLEEPSYRLFLDTQQSINLGILKRFEHEGITLAYPTQTVFLEREAGEGVDSRQG